MKRQYKSKHRNNGNRKPKILNESSYGLNKDLRELQVFQKDIDSKDVEQTINKVLDKGFIEDLGNMESNVKKQPTGRPKVDKQRIKSVISDRREGERVVPIYDGFGDQGGMTYLTPYEHKFVIAFCNTGNQAESARIASPVDSRKNTERRWNKVGNDLMRRPQVRQAIGYMQKKICVAAALDSTEVISNIREIAALAMVDGKYEAALKANQALGEYLGMFNNTSGKNLKNVTPNGQQGQMVDIFKSGDELIDNRKDITDLVGKLGFNISKSDN